MNSVTHMVLIATQLILLIMVPFVAKSADEEIEWNKRAIELAEKSYSVEAEQWLGSLYNNIRQAYLESEQYTQALSAFTNALILGSHPLLSTH